MEGNKHVVESREGLPFDLVITITRHGLKEGIDGPLSKEGMEATDKHYEEVLTSSPSEVGRMRRVVTSPKARASQTAQIQEANHEYLTQARSITIETEDALSEQDIVAYFDTLPEEKRANWFKHWYEDDHESSEEIPGFRDVVRSFSVWLLKEIDEIKTSGGNLDIDAFSHGPLMGAVLLSLEDELGQDIITSTSAGENRIDRAKMFDLYNGQLRALQNMKFSINSGNPNIIKLNILDKTVSIPIDVLIKFASV